MQLTGGLGADVVVECAGTNHMRAVSPDAPQGWQDRHGRYSSRTGDAILERAGSERLTFWPYARTQCFGAGFRTHGFGARAGYAIVRMSFRWTSSVMLLLPLWSSVTGR